MGRWGDLSSIVAGPRDDGGSLLCVRFFASFAPFCGYSGFLYVFLPKNIPRYSHRHLDRSLRNQPSKPDQPRLPHVRYTHDSGFTPAFPRSAPDSRILEDPALPVHARLDLPIPRTRCRGQASRIPQRLALSLSRPSLVAKNDRQRI